MPVTVKATFDLDADTWDCWLDGSQVVNGQAIMDGYLNSVVIGFEWSGNTTAENPNGFSGVMQYDNLYMEQVPEPATLSLLGIGVLVFLRKRRTSK